MADNAFLNPHRTDAPLMLTPYPNGGWVVTAPSEDPRCIPVSLGAFGSANEMLIALDRSIGTPKMDLTALRAAHAEWSQAQFGNVSAVGPAKHLAKEALEVAEAPTDPIEHADCWMLLWDMQRRAGITDEALAMAIAQKLTINKARNWPEPKEGEAREHSRSGDDEAHHV